MESKTPIQTVESFDFSDVFSDNSQESTKEGSQKEDIPNGHDDIQWAKKTVAEALEGNIPHQSINRILNGSKGDGRGVDCNKLRAVASYLVGANTSFGKEVEIPHIKPTSANGLTISDLPRSEYAKISVLMGLIFDCCAYPGGGGGQLCKAAQISEYYKIITIRSMETNFINALTVVTCDKARQNLIILGLEVNTLPNKTYAHLLFNAAKQMVKQEGFQNAYLAVGGRTLYNIDFCNKQELSYAVNTRSSKVLVDFTRRAVLNTTNQKIEGEGATSALLPKVISAKGVDNFELMQNPQIRFEKLSHLPEAGVLLRIAKNSTQGTDDVKEAIFTKTTQAIDEEQKDPFTELTLNKIKERPKSAGSLRGKN